MAKVKTRTVDEIREAIQAIREREAVLKSERGELDAEQRKLRVGFGTVGRSDRPEYDRLQARIEAINTELEAMPGKIKRLNEQLRDAAAGDRKRREKELVKEIAAAEAEAAELAAELQTTRQQIVAWKAESETALDSLAGVLDDEKQAAPLTARRNDLAGLTAAGEHKIETLTAQHRAVGDRLALLQAEAAEIEAGNARRHRQELEAEMRILRQRQAAEVEALEAKLTAAAQQAAAMTARARSMTRKE